MDDRSNSSPTGPHATGSPRLLIDQDELRSILSNLSHELCRPLVSLRAGFDLLLGDSESAMSLDQRGHLSTMVTLCDDLLRLTRSYLDYAAIVQGSRPLRLGSFTISALIDEIDRQFGPLAQARQVDWRSHSDPAGGIVMTDAARCQQIFGNLVSNALKYTPAGGQVRVSGKVDADSWSVIVADSGPGIPADSVDKVFEPFFRLARDERSGVEGSGLGLAICRELVTQLGGEITLQSTIGVGTSISVRFPVNTNLTAHPRPPQRHDGPVAADAARRRSRAG